MRRLVKFSQRCVLALVFVHVCVGGNKPSIRTVARRGEHREHSYKVQGKKALFLHNSYGFMKRNYIYTILIISAFLQFAIVGFVNAGEEADAQESPSKYISDLINKARSNPWAEAERLGLDPVELRENILPAEVVSLWDAGLWPVFRNPILEKASIAMCEDMLAKGYLSTVSPDGVTPMDRILAEGYPAGPVWADFGVLAFDFYLDVQEGASAIFDQMMKETMLSQTPKTGMAELVPSLLYPWLPDAGAAVCGGYFEVDGYVFYVYVLTVIFSRPSPDSGYKVQCGYFYDDMNGNLQYDPGEGVPDLQLFDPVEEKILTVTGPRGEYCLGNIQGGEVFSCCGGYYLMTDVGIEGVAIIEDGSMVRKDYEVGGFVPDGRSGIVSDKKMLDK